MSFWNYINVGFEHVVPWGYDHILFIVSLFFLNSKIKTAFIQCTVFTFAHSITLALVTLGYIPWNAAWVETVIALSIVFVSFENLFQPRLKAARLLLIFFFGLIHGMGFASALRGVGLPQNDLVLGILGFNLGVEIAQLLLIASCYLFIARWFSNKIRYQTKLVNPISLIISGIAFFWVIERFLIQ